MKELKDDDLILTDKVGSGVYFWSFPAVAGNTAKRKLQNVEGDLEKETERQERLFQRQQQASSSRVSGEERQEKLRRLQALEAEKQTLLASVQQQQDCDPEFLKSLIDDAKVAKEAANRWTDNADQVSPDPHWPAAVGSAGRAGSIV
jgi:hypothetical protein